MTAQSKHVAGANEPREPVPYPSEPGWFVGIGEVVHECEPGILQKTQVVSQCFRLDNLICSGCGLPIPPPVKTTARIWSF